MQATASGFGRYVWLAKLMLYQKTLHRHRTSSELWKVCQAVLVQTTFPVHRGWGPRSGQILDQETIIQTPSDKQLADFFKLANTIGKEKQKQNI